MRTGTFHVFVRSKVLLLHPGLVVYWSKERKLRAVELGFP